MAISALGGALAGGLGASLGQVSNAESGNYGLGLGYTTGKSWSEGGGSSWQQSESHSQSDEVADSLAATFGTEASAKDVDRAKEANDVQYKMWKMQADFNASEAEKERQWQERLANTAYRRTVTDLVKAGLNPYLAATSLGGAATPSGAVATSGLATSHKAQTFADQLSKSHSEGHSQSESYGSGGGSNYSIGGSNNYGINIDVNAGKSTQSSQPAIGKIVSDAVRNATQSTTAKAEYDDKGFRKNNTSSSNGSWKGFESNAYD